MSDGADGRARRGHGALPSGKAARGATPTPSQVGEEYNRRLYGKPVGGTTTIGSGTRLGPYEVLGTLGSGGMGVVYTARDTRLDRLVAVKVLRPDTAADPDRLRRFEIEAHAVSALNHPNILTIHDVGTHDGVPYFVAELLHGQTLRRRLAGGPPPLHKALEYAKQIAAGLAAAHDKQIVHRDLKPENLFITDQGRVKILDFGVARMTRPETPAINSSEAATESVATERGVLIGTMAYMSPEQIRGLRADLRSDVFSLGIVLYELVCGNRPFKAETTADVATAILREDPFETGGPCAALPPLLARIVQHCLEKKPEERFQSARDVWFALDTLALLSDPQLAPTARRGWRATAVVVAGLIASAAAGLMLGGWMTSAPPSLPVFQQLTARRGFILSARFARDGESVLYGAAWDNRPVEMFMTSARRAGSTPLPVPSADVLSVSPSGELALSLGRHYVEGFASSGTLARGTAGTAPREVLDAVQDAEWDGTEELIVSRRVEGKHRLEWPIGRIVHTTAGWLSHPRLSPDRNHVVLFEHPIYGDDRGAVLIIDRQGARKVVSDGWSSLTGLDWSASGEEVWFSASRQGTQRELLAISSSGQLRTVLRVPGSLTLYDVAPDGRLLLGQETLRSIATGVAPGEQEEHDLSSTDFSIGHDLSVDGRTALLSEGGVGTSSLYAAYLRRMDGSPAVRLGEGQPMALSPDQKWVLVLMFRTPPELMLLPTRAGTARFLSRGRIDRYSYVASWFPDGKRVLFQASEGSGHERLYAQSIDGGDPQALTPEGVHLPIFTDPISPDGSTLAALGPDERLRLYDLRGGPPRTVNGVAVGEAPLLWSRDGKVLCTVERLTSSRLRLNKVDLARQRKAPFRDIAPPVAGLMTILHVQAAVDCSAYIYSYWQRLSDLYVVDGVR